MNADQRTAWQSASIADFQRHSERDDALEVVSRLDAGLDVLRHKLIHRIHEDVEREFGMDSMLLPASENKSIARVRAEIELYHVAVSTVAVQDYGYLGKESDWYLGWLTYLRLGDLADHVNVPKRIETYLSFHRKDRRLAFTNILARTMPESRRAPLVLFRLYPLAVQIATAVAFADPLQANELRAGQTELLPVIGDCRECHGAVLDSGDACEECGNPVWRFDWLKSS